MFRFVLLVTVRFLLLYTSLPGLTVSVVTPNASAALTTQNEITAPRRGHVNRYRVEGNGGPAVRIGTSLQLASSKDNTHLDKAINFRGAYDIFFERLAKTSGGIRVGGKLRPLELIIMDNQNDLEIVKANFEEMSDDGINLFIAPFGSDQTKVAAEALDGSRSVIVAPASTDLKNYYNDPENKSSGRKYNHLFGIMSHIDPKYKEIIDILRPNISSLSTVLFSNTRTYKPPCEWVRNYAADLNIVLKHEQFDLSHSYTDGEAEEVIKTLAADPPDAVVACIPSNGDDCARFLRLIKKHKFAPKALLLDICLTSAQEVDKMGDMAQYVMGITRWAPTSDTSTYSGMSGLEYFERYYESHLVAPRYHGLMAWAALTALVYAVETANTTNVVDVRSQLSAMELPTISGIVKFNDVGMGTASFMATQSTAQNRIFPGKYVYPFPTWEARECADMNPQAESFLGLINGTCRDCPLGSRSMVVGSQRLCEACPVGTFALTLETYVRCETCKMGTFSSAKGATMCDVCTGGLHQNMSGQTNCKPCAEGKHSPKPAAVNCADCDPGKYSEAGATSCTPCPRGRYSDGHGSGECVSCGADLSTPYPGAASPEFCGCPSGKYLPMPRGTIAAATYFALANNSDGCNMCPWGMYCPGFFPGTDSDDTGAILAGWHRQPLTSTRFFAIAEEPYTAYLCKNPKWCPGNRVPGFSCAENRKYFGCGACKSQYKEEKNGDCRKCEDVDALYFKIASVAIFLVLPFVVYFSYDVNMVHAIQSPKHVALSTGHIFVYFLESCAILGDMNIKWPYPMDEMLAASSIFSFDLDALSPACALGNTYKFESKYSTAVSIPVIIGFYLGLSFLVTNIFIKTFQIRCRGLRFERIVCTFGIIFVALYVAVCRSSLRMFECFKVSPDGRRQLSAFPYVECSSDRWWSVVPVGIVACLLYGVGTFAFAVWLCRVAVDRFLKNDARFCKCFGFLFHEFRRDCWWWLPIVLVRNLLLPMALVIAPGDGQAQSGLFFFINLLYLVLLLTFWPWLTNSVNMMDTLTMGIGLLLICSLTSSFLDEAAEKPDQAVYATLLTSTLVVALIILGGLWGGSMFCHLITRLTGSDTCHRRLKEKMRQFSSKTSDIDLAKSLLEVSQAIVGSGIEAAEEHIAHLGHSDHITVENYVSIACVELCKWKMSQVPRGLPQRLVIGKTMNFLMDSVDPAMFAMDNTETTEVIEDAGHGKNDEQVDIDFNTNPLDQPGPETLKFTITDTPAFAITASPKERSQDCPPKVPRNPGENNESPLEVIKPAFQAAF